MIANDLHTPRADSVPGWSALQHRLATEIAHTGRSGPAFAVLVLDLDRFRTVNDSLGHALGDQLLLEVADRLVNVVGNSASMAHLGGDEFAVVAHGCGDADQAMVAARRIQDAFRQPFSIDGHEQFVSLSVGITLGVPGCRTPDEYLRDADTAMYLAKASGRPGCVVFEPGMRTRLADEHRLEHDLRGAIARREFDVHYQPIVNLGNGTIEGFEALVRWRHPHRGVLYPDSFIPTAERSGLIVPIGWMVLEEACRRLSAWQHLADTPTFISVNFSGRQFMQPDVVRQVERIVSETGCPTGRLRLELTETMIMENAELGVEKLSRLSDLDVQLYIDDFGTGYSSLSYLHRLPTHAIKIDRSFVSQVTGKPEIVGTILTLAHELNMRVEAEGIETEAQLVRLRELGCEFGQGHYFSPAVTAETAASMVGTRVFN